MWRPLDVEASANCSLTEVAYYPFIGLICGVRDCPILLKPLFFSLKASPVTKSNPELIQNFNVMLRVDGHGITLIFEPERSNDVVLAHCTPGHALD